MGWSGVPAVALMAIRRVPAGLSGRPGQQISHSYQVISRCCEGEHPSDSIRPPEPGFSLQRDGLHPAEDFLNTLALPLAHRVALVTRRSSVNRAPPVGRVLRHMRSDVQAAQLFDERLRIVTTVSTQCQSFSCGLLLHHLDGGSERNDAGSSIVREVIGMVKRNLSEAKRR